MHLSKLLIAVAAVTYLIGSLPTSGYYFPAIGLE